MPRTAPCSATSNGCCRSMHAAITTNTRFQRPTREIAALIVSSAVGRRGGPTIVFIRTTTTTVLSALLNDIGMNGMSDDIYANDTGVATDLFAAGDGNLFQ